MWLQILPNAISEEDINKILSLADKNDRTIATTEDNLSEIRKSEIIFFNPDTELWVFNIIGTIAEWANAFYHFNIEKIGNAQYTEYDESYEGYYDWHIDSFPLKSQELQRKLSITIQLSDSKDYEGGDFILDVEPGSDYDIRKKGTAIIFPSYLRHTIKPVTKGKRKSLVSWVEGAEFI